MKLPFHVDRPLETAILVGGASVICAVLWWAYKKDLLWVRGFVSAYFRRRLGTLGPEKADSAARICLASLAILFACGSLFGLSVAFGFIENGDKRIPVLSEESQALQEYLGGRGGRIDVKELVRQNELKRDQNR